MKWTGEEPKSCDLCSKPITKRFVDGVVKGGGWGILCSSCHDQYGVGLGTGRGQLYERNEQREFVKIRG